MPDLLPENDGVQEDLHETDGVEGDLLHENDGVEEDLEKQRRDREARAQALTLEMMGDLPFAEVKPPENVLFVCKLNPVTRDDDLELIFGRFGKILGCEVIRDRKTGDSLQYCFIEYEEKAACEAAYFKMQGVLIDDRRIHVDFSQSVSKLSDVWRNDTNTKRKANASRGGWGGVRELEKRRQYRNEVDQPTGMEGKLVYGEEEMKPRHERRGEEEMKPRHERSGEEEMKSRHERSGGDRRREVAPQKHGDLDRGRKYDDRSRSPPRRRDRSRERGYTSKDDGRRDRRDRDRRDHDRDRDRDGDRRRYRNDHYESRR